MKRVMKKLKRFFARIERNCNTSSKSNLQKTVNHDISKTVRVTKSTLETVSTQKKVSISEGYAPILQLEPFSRYTGEKSVFLT